MTAQDTDRPDLMGANEQEPSLDVSPVTRRRNGLYPRLCAWRSSQLDGTGVQGRTQSLPSMAGQLIP